MTSGSLVPWLAAALLGCPNPRTSGEGSLPIPQPAPGGARPGDGCTTVTLVPPCTLYSFGVEPDAEDAAEVFYRVTYQDSKGARVMPFYVNGRPEDERPLRAFFDAHASVGCTGHWSTAPCNDTPFLSGFPEPPVGRVKKRGY